MCTVSREVGPLSTGIYVIANLCVNVMFLLVADDVRNHTICTEKKKESLPI